MSPQNSKVADLASVLKSGLDNSFTVLPAVSYVAIIHPELGLAAVVPDDSEKQAQEAAAALTAKASLVGIKWDAIHFGISPTKVSPPWLIRAGAGAITDITSTMKMLSGVRPPLGRDGALKVIDQLKSDIQKSATQNIVAVRPSKTGLDPKLLRMFKVSVEKALKDRPASLAGVEIDADDFASPSFMLPALLVSAGLKWAVPVVAKRGQGGFLVTMEKDDKAVLGYTVTKIDYSAPLLLFVPMIDVIRRSFKNGECVMDDVVQEFSNYLDNNKLDNSELSGMEISTSA